MRFSNQRGQKLLSLRLSLTWLCVVVLSSPGLVHGKPGPAAQVNPFHVSLSQPLTVRWRYATTETLNLTPAADNDRIYLPLASGVIVSLNASDGHLYWKTEIGGEFSASPAADDKAIYVAAETTTPDSAGRPPSASLRALGREAGVTLWLKTLPVAIQGSLAMSDRKLFAGTRNGGFYAFDKNTGDVVWFVQIGSAFNCTPTLISKAVYVGSEDGTLIALEEATGKIKWRFKTGGPVRGPVAIVDGTVYLGSGDGYVYAVDESEGHLRWRTRTGAGVQAVKSVARGLLVASFDNFVYLLNFQQGKRLWKKQLPGRLSAQPATADDGALFTPLSAAAGVVLGLRDGKLINSLPTGEAINTAAAPLIVSDAVLLTTDQGLLAFAQPGKTNAANWR